MASAVDEDKMLAEDAVENAIQFLRSTDNSSVHQRNKYRKILKNELFFLKDSHPDSYVLKYDISDISLELER